MKLCSKCKELKHYKLFGYDGKAVDGLASWCKKCKNNLAKEYNKTKLGLTSRMYYSQRHSCKKRNHKMPEYNREEFQNWVLNHHLFEELYNNWVESGYDKKLRPSIDRLDDYKSYTFDNIRLCTWHENNLKHYIDVKKGINNKTNKSVLQYDLDGNYINEYHSISYAARITKIRNADIQRACSGIYKQAGGYAWEYSDYIN